MTVVYPLFADADANLLAALAVAVVAFLIFEILREQRNKRKKQREAERRRGEPDK